MQMPFDAGEMSDEALLAAYGRGEARAARALADRLLPGVWRTARRLLGDAAEAEDVAQEAMLRLWRIAPDWRAGEAKVSTWLYRVTVNLCTDRLRRRRGVALDAMSEPEDGAPGAGGAADRGRPDGGARRGASARCPSGSGRRWCCGISRGWPTPRSPRSWAWASRRWKA
jgi:hypothetical protein